MMTEKSGMIVSGSGWVPLSFYRKGGRGLRVLITLTQNAQLSRNKKIIRGLTDKGKFKSPLNFKQMLCNLV